VTSTVIRFREFELDCERYELRRNGRAVKLEKMPMELLILLAAKKGHLVSRQEMVERLWGNEVYVDSEHGINTAIRKLRQALHDDPEKPRFLETVTGKGYRFIAETIVEEPAAAGILPIEIAARNGSALNAGSVPAEAGDAGIAEQNVAVEAELIGNHRRIAQPDAISPAPVGKVDGPETKIVNPANEVVQRRQRWWLPAAAVFAFGLGGLAWYLHRPLPVPRIAEYKQITHDGNRKWLIGTDGSRLYFNSAPTYEPFEIGVAGGDSMRIQIAMNAPVISSVSPDGSTLLIQQWENNNLWSAGIPGGPLRRLTTFDTHSANWSPNGKEIVYTTPDGAISLMRSDGTDAHRLASAQGPIYDIAWSPDGGRLRLTNDRALWEISSSGSNLHPLLPEWPAKHCCGRWTPDGRFFVFLSGIRHIAETTVFLGSQIWIIDERRGLIRGPSPQPLQLTSGPMGWCCITPSQDGKTIFATGQTARGELVRFDAKSRQLQPHMGGISAEFLSYSRDGKSVAYATYPDGNLWRANSDGSGRVQLSGATAYPSMIRWSPDGARLAFDDLASSKDHDVMYLIPAQGGNPTRIIPTDDGPSGDPTWSPDGNRIVFFTVRTNDIRIVDLANHQITTLPGSAGLYSPRWSPDGRSIVAMTEDSETLKVFDLATQQWSTLLKHDGGMGFPNWSHDGRYVYILYLSSTAGIYRVRATGGEAERVVDLTGFHLAGMVGFWFGLDPTDAPLLLRDAGTDDIYALTLETK
jgi:Tol biopolymer transport system component/DNA-binding winged helix-turn-helix (wHTH) protein